MRAENALIDRIAYEEHAKTQECACIGCKNKATHTWSGHPTCDSCGSPGRIKRELPMLIGMPPL